MKCQACEMDIPSNWVNALQSNICPSCGQPIMNDEVVKLREGLADAISKMDFNAQEITTWLISNYRLEKIGDGEPTGFFRPKGNKVVGGVEYPEDKVEQLNQFFKRADAPAGLIGRSKKDLLKSNTNSDFDDPEDDADDYDDVDVDNMPKVDPRYKDVTSSDVLSKDEVEAIALKARAARKLKARAAEPVDTYAPEEYSELPDFEKMSPALRAIKIKEQEKLLEARENVLSGIRTNKNGFTRSG
jgi:hypothetical protein